jgi:hypothetical protein
MYWNNPLVELIWPAITDPIADSLHDGQHCVFYNPAVDKQQIQVKQRLQDLCNWANDNIFSNGINEFVTNQKNYYDISNLVKLNIWVDDLPKRGSIKPMLLHYVGLPMYTPGTGESRLRALERIDSITTVSAFISTHRQYQDRFDHLESITTLDRFAEICKAIDNQNFLFRLTDKLAPYGLDWYEYNSQQTTQVTPGEDQCVTMLSNYLAQYPKTVFTPAWFDCLVNWDSYKNC